jgi:hypothetical protein
LLLPFSSFFIPSIHCSAVFRLLWDRTTARRWLVPLRKRSDARVYGAAAIEGSAAGLIGRIDIAA